MLVKLVIKGLKTIECLLSVFGLLSIITFSFLLVNHEMLLKTINILMAPRQKLISTLTNSDALFDAHIVEVNQSVLFGPKCFVLLVAKHGAITKENLQWRQFSPVYMTTSLKNQDLRWIDNRTLTINQSPYSKIYRFRSYVAYINPLTQYKEFVIHLKLRSRYEDMQSIPISNLGKFENDSSEAWFFKGKATP